MIFQPTEYYCAEVLNLLSEIIQYMFSPPTVVESCKIGQRRN